MFNLTIINLFFWLFCCKFLDKSKICTLKKYITWNDYLFCNDKSLTNKTKTLGAKVIRLMKSNKINPEKSYVFFKNNCPLNGPLYDSFSICDIKTGDVQFWITPKSGHSKQAEVYAAPDFNDPAASGTWKDITKYFGV